MAIKSAHAYQVNFVMQAGISIVQLMISIALGLLVLLIAMAMVVTTKVAFSLQTDLSDMQESSTFAMDNIARSLRQAGYLSYDISGTSQLLSATASPDIIGLDASSLSATTTDISTVLKSTVNSSDVLAIRFFGAGNTKNGDGTILNCAGFSVPAPLSSETADEDRGWSIYYVAENSNKEPELFCKYQSINSKSGNMSWSAQAIIKGVESFQVLYGIDVPVSESRSIKRYLNANEINAMDAGLVLTGNTSIEKSADLNRKTFWKKVNEVRVAMLLSGEAGTRSDSLTTTYHLFGEAYAAIAGETDKGTSIKEIDLPLEKRNRLRKVYVTTVVLRNNCAVDPIHQTCLAPV
ncbi:PilW family protein [Undibacterium sp. MH2W]